MGPRRGQTVYLGVLLDIALAGSLVLMWLTDDGTPWMQLAFVWVACGAFVHKGGRATAARSAVAGLAATLILAVAWIDGKPQHDHLARVPLLVLLGFLFAAFAARHDRSERAVVRDRTRLERTIDALPLATVAFDERDRVVTWNRAAQELFGWRAEEVIGRKSPVVPVDETQSSGDLARRILAGEAIGVEVHAQARDGRLLELAVYSAPVAPSRELPGGFLLVYQEIGKRKRAERERDLAQRQYRELVEAVPLITYIDEVDDNATNVYTSPQLAAVLGWTPEEWSSDPFFFEKILHSDDRERVLAEVKHANDTREPFQSEYRLLHRDGRAVWFRDHSAIVEGAAGKPFARGFLLDITEQKRLEGQLLQAQKMDAIGQFAGGIAHDFNNLLTGISGYATLAEGSTEDGLVARAIAGIKSAAAEASSLTSQLLAFTRRDVPERRLVDLNEVVRGSGELLGRLVREDVRVALELADSLPAVAADAAQLRQIVLNLALNARDAMDEGGTLTIETDQADAEVVLRVRDTGRGMDAGTRLRAFEPFFTTKPEGEGTGLGLAVVYGIVEALGGTVAVESEPGRGTTIEVLLPAATGNELPAGPLDLVEPSGARGVERVLIVEDRAVVRELAREVLESAGFEVATARGGTEALTFTQSNGGFSLLLTDVVMPEMSGPDLAKRIRAHQPDLRVIYMSGYTDDVLDPAELTQPGTRFLRKPFGIADLTATVRELLDAPVRLI